VKYNTFVTFWLTCCLLVFSCTCTGRTAGPVFTLYDSNDCFHTMRYLFGDRTIGDVTWGKYAPKPLKAKTPKYKNRNISDAVNPIISKFKDHIGTINYTSWVICHNPISNPTWLTVAILKMAMTSMVRFRWNPMQNHSEVVIIETGSKISRWRSFVVRNRKL